MRLIVILLLLISSISYAGDLYFWVDENGIKRFSDTPVALPSNVQVIKNLKPTAQAQESTQPTANAQPVYNNIQQTTVIVQQPASGPTEEIKTEAQINEEKAKLKERVYEAKMSYLKRRQSRQGVSYEDRQHYDDVMFDLKKDKERLSPNEFFDVHGKSTNFRPGVQEVRLVD